MTDLPAPSLAEGSPEVARAEAPAKRLWREFKKSPVAVVGLVLVVIMAGSAIFAPLIAPQDPYDLAQLDILDGRLPPGAAGFGDVTYWLGTDDQGRDMLSAMLYGLRASLGIALASTVIAGLFGSVLGLIAAFAGGRTETLIMRAVDLQLSFPAILVALILLAVLGRGVDKVLLALIVVQWAYYARTIRGQALVERRREYVEAATCLGLGSTRIIFRHLLPNCLPPVIVVGTVQVANAIALEATLSFLGVGVPITEPSLGLLIANGYGYMLSGDYWISVFPGLALVLAIVSINLVGDRLRDLLNPRLRR